MASRLLTVSIRNYVNRQPRGKRRNRTVRYIREQIAHYTGMEVEQVKLDKKLNEKIVKFYSKSAVPVKMKLEIDKDKVIAAPFLAENTEIPIVECVCSICIFSTKFYLLLPRTKKLMTLFMEFNLSGNMERMNSLSLFEKTFNLDETTR